MTTPDYRHDMDGNEILVATHRLMPPGRPPHGSDPAERLESPDAVQHYRTVSRPGFKGVMRLGNWRALRPAEPPVPTPAPEPVAKRAPGRPLREWPRMDSDPGDRRIGPHGLSVATYRCPPRRDEKDREWAKRPDVMQCYTWWTADGQPMPGCVPAIEWRAFAVAEPAEGPEGRW